jgi:hypothetical protein
MGCGYMLSSHLTPTRFSVLLETQTPTDESEYTGKSKSRQCHSRVVPRREATAGCGWIYVQYGSRTLVCVSMLLAAALHSYKNEDT